jgi:hypothetical protein
MQAGRLEYAEGNGACIEKIIISAGMLELGLEKFGHILLILSC